MNRCTYASSLLSLPPAHSHPSRLSQSPSMSSQQIPIGSVFTYVNICAAMLLSPFLSPSPPLPSVHKSVLLSAYLLLLSEQSHRYHPFRLHIYALIYDICFLDFPLYNRL